MTWNTLIVTRPVTFQLLESSGLQTSQSGYYKLSSNSDSGSPKMYYVDI